MTRRADSARTSVRKTRDKVGERCLIFGGAGFIGTSLAAYLRVRGIFDTVVLADIQPQRRFGYDAGIEYVYCDVRESVQPQIGNGRFDWIINLAAIHREPGHAAAEYFDTNVPGARNICEFAGTIDCGNLLFASSIAVYGPTPEPISEAWPCHPDTAYGASKLVAEEIHRAWLSGGSGRRLIIVRPGVVYGPGDRANMLRLIRLLQSGFFVLPGNSQIYKSYAYIEGLCDALLFAMRQSDELTIFNYVEKETLSMAELIRVIQSEFGLHRPIPELPTRPLELIAHAAQIVSGGRSAIHPQRVKKLSRPTHIVPQYLIDRGFQFRYGLKESLRDWHQRSPQDFYPKGITQGRFALMLAANFLERYFDNK